MKKVHQAGIGRGRLNPRQKTIEKKNRKQVTRYAMYLLTNVLQKKKRNKANFGTVKKAAINITTVLLIIPQFKTFKKTGVYRKLPIRIPASKKKRTGKKYTTRSIGAAVHGGLRHGGLMPAAAPHTPANVRKTVGTAINTILLYW